MNSRMIENVAESLTQRCIVHYPVLSDKGQCIVHDQETYDDECPGRRASVDIMRSALEFVWRNGYGEGLKVALRD